MREEYWLAVFALHLQAMMGTMWKLLLQENLRTLFLVIFFIIVDWISLHDLEKSKDVYAPPKYFWENIVAALSILPSVGSLLVSR